MSILLLSVVIFIFSLLLIELIFYAYRSFMHPDRSEVRRRLRQSLVEESAVSGGNILKNELFSEVPFINRMITLLPGVDRMQLTFKQANVQYTLGFFILFSMALGFTGYLSCSVFTKNTLLSFPTAVALGSLPFFYVLSKKKKRMGKFEKQLPEALGLIARALRAGHAFTTGMKLAAEEFGDPLGPYFAETLDEINFGVSVDGALKNLAIRVDCPDMRFFIVSVILQRETGGNLAEIIEGLANLIRERFRFRGKVKTLSAEGRLTGKILVAIPIILFSGIYLVNPKYASTLIEDPIGKVTIGIAICMMFIAGLVIKRIVSLDV